MYPGPRSFALLFFLVLASLANSAAAADCPEPVARLVSAEGDVHLQRPGGDWQRARADQSLCAGHVLRTGAHSRAALVLTDKSLVRLDQRSTLRLVSAPAERSTLAELLEGFLYFFSRTPQQLELRSPYLNASVDGTEFAMHVSGERARLLVFEGEVLAANENGQLRLAAGQGAEAAGGAPLRVPASRDAVEWALHFPPLAQAGDPAVTGSAAAGALAEALETARDGDLPGALAALDDLPEARRDNGYHAVRAGLLLQAGDVAAARDALDQAEAEDAGLALVPALRSIIALVTGEEAQALTQARTATKREAGSPAAWIALSYAEQSRFRLEAALEAARRAVAADPASALAQGRRAELLLAQGRSGEALAAARRAVELDRRLAPAHMVLGFAHLNRIELAKARSAFQAAVERDQAAALPRLGLGLADIRDGRLAEGRRALEVAVALDPSRSLLRSYLGKAYYEERRNTDAATEYAIALELDPADPTAWFYDAIRQQTANQPVAALEDLKAAQTRNDNRAVYRSRLLLDDDAAARDASQGRIYRDLGFGELGLRQGWRSVANDPSSHAGHRLLADIYSSRPRHENARVSELLQAQMLQPLTLNPVPPQLAESDLLVVESSGPTALAFNEFNPMFVRDGLAVQADGLYGSNDTWADDLVVSGIAGPVSVSLGQFHYESDGFRDNNDLRHDIYNVFAQWAVTRWLNIQAEHRSRETEQGDLALRFDPDDFDPTLRRTIDQETTRVGLRLSPSPASDLIVAGFYTERENPIAQQLTVPVAPPPVPPLVGDVTASSDEDGYQAEAQYIHRWQRVQAVAGGAWFGINVDQPIDVEGLPPPIEAAFEGQSARFRRENTNGYLYTHLELPRNAVWTLGGSYGDFENRGSQVRRFNPKLGLQWQPTRAIGLRAAWFRTVSRPGVTDQTLEPTQVAGFNQFYADLAGTRIEQYGIGLDLAPLPALAAGAEYTFRELEVPITVAGTGTLERFDRDEHLIRSYLYWTPSDSWALALEPQYERFLRGNDDPTVGGGALATVETILLPVSLKRFGPGGLFAGATATGVFQEIEAGPGVTPERDDEQFLQVDISAGWRLPNRQGIVSLAVENLFDREFFYQDLNAQTSGDAVPPRFVPDRRIVARATLRFP